jgi:hypothetical protein
MRQLANLLAAHGTIEVLVIRQRPMHVLRIAWRLAKTGIEIGHELRRIPTLPSGNPIVLDQQRMLELDTAQINRTDQLAQRRRNM